MTYEHLYNFTLYEVIEWLTDWVKSNIPQQHFSLVMIFMCTYTDIFEKLNQTRIVKYVRISN